MSRALLITGTDTEVGKTFVAVGLICAFTRLGLSVAPFKPVETGCLQDDVSGELLPADARMLEAASGTAASLDVICPFRFSLPVAPWVAAEKAGRTIDLSVLDNSLEQLQSAHDCVLIETAGGMLVPLARDVDFAILARRWNVPVLVVAGSRLGVLNQTLLTVRHAELVGLKLAGVVLNHPFGDRRSSTLGAIHYPALDTNAETLGRMISHPVWEVPFEDAQDTITMDAVFNNIAAALADSLREGQTRKS